MGGIKETEMAYYNAQKTPEKKANEAMKDSRKQSSDRAFEPKLRQNRGQRREWENASGRETQQVTMNERETVAQAAWRKNREDRVNADVAADARSAKVSSRERCEEPASPRSRSLSPSPSAANQKIEDRLQADAIKGEWTDAQLDFERRKAGVLKKPDKQSVQDLKADKQEIE